MIELAMALVWIVRAYLAVGAAFAVVFALVGVTRIDPNAAFDRQAPIGSLLFRVVLLPGAALLWPWLAWRWVRGTHPSIERNAHRRAAAEAAR